MRYIEDIFLEERDIPFVKRASFMAVLIQPSYIPPEPILTPQVKTGLLKLALMAKMAQSPEEIAQQAEDQYLDPNVQMAMDYQQLKQERDKAIETVQQVQQQSSELQQRVTQAENLTNQLQQQLDQETQAKNQALQQTIDQSDQNLTDKVTHQNYRETMMRAADEFQGQANQLLTKIRELAATHPQILQQQQTGMMQQGAQPTSVQMAQQQPPVTQEANKAVEEAANATNRTALQDQQAQQSLQQDYAKQQGAQQQPGMTVQASLDISKLASRIKQKISMSKHAMSPYLSNTFFGLAHGGATGALGGAVGGALSSDENRLGNALRGAATGGIGGALLGTAGGLAGTALGYRKAKSIDPKNVSADVAEDFERTKRILGKNLSIQEYVQGLPRQGGLGISWLMPTTTTGAALGYYDPLKLNNEPIPKTSALKKQKLAFTPANLLIGMGGGVLGSAIGGGIGGALGAEPGDRLRASGRGAAAVENIGTAIGLPAGFISSITDARPLTHALPIAAIPAAIAAGIHAYSKERARHPEQSPIFEKNKAEQFYNEVMQGYNEPIPKTSSLKKKLNF